MGDQDGSQKPSQLALYEEMFKERYTDNDHEFVNLRDTPLPPPPVVYPWEQFKRFRNDGYDRRQDRRYGGNNRPYRERNRDYYRDNRRDNWERRDYRQRDDSPERRRYYGHSSRDNR